MTAAYIRELLGVYPAIKQVWLIGSRADDSAKPTSDWDYIVMADQSTLDALSVDSRFNNAAVDLLVVYDGDQFREPWPDRNKDKHGSLSGWEWQVISECVATYKATKPRDDDDFYSWIQQGRATLVHPAPTM